MKKTFRFLSICLITLCCGTSYADIEGKYECSGVDPFMKENYTMSLDLQKTGDTYKLEWHSINENYSGTALLVDASILTAVFSSHGIQKKYGVIVYDLAEKDFLKGKWTYQFQSILGSETCKKVH